MAEKKQSKVLNMTDFRKEKPKEEKFTSEKFCAAYGIFETTAERKERLKHEAIMVSIKEHSDQLDW